MGKITQTTPELQTILDNDSVQNINIAQNTEDISNMPDPSFAIEEVGSSKIGGDKTGNERGSNALDIQSGRSNVANVASGNTSLTIGYDNLVSGIKSLAIGYKNIVNTPRYI